MKASFQYEGQYQHAISRLSLEAENERDILILETLIHYDLNDLQKNHSRNLTLKLAGGSSTCVQFFFIETKMESNLPIILPVLQPGQTWPKVKK